MNQAECWPKPDVCETARHYGVAMDAAEAVRIAAAHFAERFQEIRTGEWVLTKPVEHPSAWVVGYQSRSYLETGSATHALAGNRPLVIPKSGEAPWEAWSGEPVDSQNRTWRTARLQLTRGT